MTPHKAIVRTLFWVISALFFDVSIYYYLGADKASQFLNVYTVEKLLSFDNLFVFLLIFNYFNIPDRKRSKVLNWGICGAVILRFIFISLGITFVNHFHFILYILGGILIYSAYGIAFGNEEDNDISKSKIISFATYFSIPLFMIWVISIELSDIMFAIDSIPAGLSLSQDMFIVYTANIFAILGLRAFYFVIQSVTGFLPQLKYSIALILAFIGFKMFLPLVNMEITAGYSLLIVLEILLINLYIILIKYKRSKRIFYKTMR